MTQTVFKPAFLDGSAGRLFALLRTPEHATDCVIFVPPFAEEMNKCRRQFSETAERLVGQGYATLVFDLFGTGDSEGDFSEARWQIWRDDVETACCWAEQDGYRVSGIIATRLGCCLAADALLQHNRSVDRAEFWQPIDSGKRYMSQFLRLRVAASMMAAGGGETVQQLQQRLAAGECLEVAGYPLSSALWSDVGAAVLPAGAYANFGALALFEVGQSKAGELSNGGQKLLKCATEAGGQATGERIDGEPFWMATEIVVNRDLQQRSVEHLTKAGSTR